VYPGEGGGCPAEEDGDDFPCSEGAGDGAGGLEAGCRGVVGGDGRSAAGGGGEAGADSAGGGDSGRSGGVGGHVGGKAGT
jgi:hypothetical protein